MFFAVGADQTKARAVGRTVGYTKIRRAFRELPKIFAAGNHPRKAARIFSVGTSSTSSDPPRVEIFLVGANGVNFPAASRMNIFPKVKSLTAAA